MCELVNNLNMECLSILKQLSKTTTFLINVSKLLYYIENPKTGLCHALQNYCKTWNIVIQCVHGLLSCSALHSLGSYTTPLFSCKTYTNQSCIRTKIIYKTCIINVINQA